MTLTGNCSDTGGSGCVGNSTKDITQETNGHYYPPDVYDQAGNSGRCNTVLVNIDKTPPECGSCTGGSTNWKKGSRTVTCTPKDSRSGIRSGSASETWDEGTHKKETISYTASDKAGNSSSCSKNVNVYIDNNKPSLEFITNPKRGGSCDVYAEYEVSDSGSGVNTVGDYWDCGNSSSINSSFLINNQELMKLYVEGLKNNTSYLKKDLLNNSSYYFNTSTASSGVKDNVRDGFYETLTAYKEASLYVEFLSNWFKNEVGGV